MCLTFSGEDAPVAPRDNTLPDLSDDRGWSFHIQNAKACGVTKEEMAEILTHAAFYVGWPKAWAAFRFAKEIYKENE